MVFARIRLDFLKEWVAVVGFIDDVYLLVLGGFSVWFVVMLWVILASIRRTDSGIDISDIEDIATVDVKRDHRVITANQVKHCGL